MSLRHTCILVWVFSPTLLERAANQSETNQYKSGSERFVFWRRYETSIISISCFRIAILLANQKEAELMNMLLDVRNRYNKRVRPVLQENKPIVIRHGVILKDISDIVSIISWKCANKWKPFDWKMVLLCDSVKAMYMTPVWKNNCQAFFLSHTKKSHSLSTRCVHTACCTSCW